jgi:hypothetical protein
VVGQAEPVDEGKRLESELVRRGAPAQVEQEDEGEEQPVERVLVARDGLGPPELAKGERDRAEYPGQPAPGEQAAAERQQGDRQRGDGGVEQVQPVGDGADRNEAPRLVQEYLERVARRMGEPEDRRDELELAGVSAEDAV